MKRNYFKQLSRILFVFLVLFSCAITLSKAQTTIDGGRSHTIVLCNNGELWSSGAGDAGQLGNGSVNNTTTLVKISGVSNVVEIEAGLEHGAARMSDGSIKMWGYNYYGTIGQGTSGPGTNFISPMTVPGLPSDIVEMSLGGDHTVMRTNTGDVWTWGKGTSGQLGNGSTNSESSPIQANFTSGITAISAGNGHTLALDSTGTLWAVGRNSDGQLGDSTTTDASTALQVTGMNDASIIAAMAKFSLAIRTDGVLWGWGDNIYGALGDGTTTNQSTPVQSNLTDVVAISGGYEHSLALKSDGTVWASGLNAGGQLGDGTNNNSSSFVQVSGLINIISISGGDNHSMALQSDGTFYVWGRGRTGQFGNGTSGAGVEQNTPLEVMNLTLCKLTVSIEDVVSNSSIPLNVYPNPSTDIINIEFELKDHKAPGSIEVLDIHGNQIIFRALGDLSTGLHQRSINVEKFAVGTYYIKLSASGQSIVKKFIVIK